MTPKQQRKHDRVSQLFADEAEVARLGPRGREIITRRRARNARKRRRRTAGGKP